MPETRRQAPSLLAGDAHRRAVGAAAPVEHPRIGALGRPICLGAVRRLTRIAVAAVIGLACAASVLAPPALAQRRALRPCRGANTPATRGSRELMRAAILCLINRQRVSRGLPRLRDSRELNRSAQSWSGRMVAGHFFSHGANFTARISAAGYDWSMAGEDIAAGFATPRQVVAGWMGSFGHCQNILDPDFADVGIGVVAHRLLRYGPSVWTLDFGLRMGRRPPSSNTGPMSRCPY